MFFLNFIPDTALLYLVNSILILGAVGSFLSFFILHKILNKFPALAPYHLLFQIISAVLLVAGVYLKGGYTVEMEWRTRAEELQEKLALAQASSQQVNTVVEERVVKKTKIIREKANTVVKYVDRPVVREFDKTCPIPKEIIEIHNEAADMNLIVEERTKEASKK